MEQIIYLFIIAYLFISPLPFHVVRTFRMKMLAKKYNLDFKSNYSVFSILISDASFSRKKVNIISGEINGVKVQVNDTLVKKFIFQKVTEYYLNNTKIEYNRGINFFTFVNMTDKWLNSVRMSNPIDLSAQAKAKKVYYYIPVLIAIILATIFYFGMIRLF